MIERKNIALIALTLSDKAINTIVIFSIIAIIVGLSGVCLKNRLLEDYIEINHPVLCKTIEAICLILFLGGLVGAFVPIMISV